MFVLSDIVAEGRQQFLSDPTCTDLPCSWSDPKGNLFKKITGKYTVCSIKTHMFFMFPGAKAEPVLVEDINSTKLSLARSLLVRKLSLLQQ